MTLWHLLHGISVATPLAGAFFVGLKSGRPFGFGMALVWGLAFSLVNFFGVHAVIWRFFQQIEKIKAEFAQSFWTALLYLGIAAWILLSGGLAIGLTRWSVSQLANPN